MRIDQRFTVGRRRDDVWEFFTDIGSVAACLPGAVLREDLGDGRYSGVVEVGLGPLSLNFEGEATVTFDHAATSGTVQGRGTDRRGGSRGAATIGFKVTPDGDGALVEIGADITLQGPAAQFGRTGLMEEIAGRLLVEFAACLESRLDAGPGGSDAITAGRVRGLRLFFGSLWRRWSRPFRRG